MVRNGDQGMTGTLYWLILAAVVLSLAHHGDHVLRGATGWPLRDEVNPFTYSLFVYPVIGLGVILSRLRLVGPRFWSVLSGGGALFVAAVHLGPAAGDAVGDIAGQHASPAAGVAALVLLAALVAVLVGNCAYELRLAHRAQKGPVRAGRS